MNQERFVSHDPEDFGPPALTTLLRSGEQDDHFGTDDKGERLKPIRVSPKVCMNWLSYAVNDLAQGAGTGPPLVTRIGTWHGSTLLGRLEVWPKLEAVFFERRQSARQQFDGRALKLLETPEPFEVVDRSNRRFSIYVYAPTYAELNEAAQVAGVSVTQIVQAALMMAVAETDEWVRHLQPELVEFERHLKRRLLVLEQGI